MDWLLFGWGAFHGIIITIIVVAIIIKKRNKATCCNKDYLRTSCPCYNQGIKDTIIKVLDTKVVGSEHEK